jgi:predicted DNA binding CopG/RHH family protein
MSEKRATDEELAQEAERWDKREITPGGWEDAPDAVPRAKESMAISIRLPVQLVSILKEFACRAGIGYQVLIKRWLDDHVREEHKRLRDDLAHRAMIIKLVLPEIVSHAASFDATGESGRQIAVRATYCEIHKPTPKVAQG